VRAAELAHRRCGLPATLKRCESLAKDATSVFESTNLGIMSCSLASARASIDFELDAGQALKSLASYRLSGRLRRGDWCFRDKLGFAGDLSERLPVEDGRRSLLPGFVSEALAPLEQAEDRFGDCFMLDELARVTPLEAAVTEKTLRLVLDRWKAKDKPTQYCKMVADSALVVRSLATLRGSSAGVCEHLALKPTAPVSEAEQAWLEKDRVLAAARLHALCPDASQPLLAGVGPADVGQLVTVRVELLKAERAYGEQQVLADLAALPKEKQLEYARGVLPALLQPGS
jgi:hypothetical protein